MMPAAAMLYLITMLCACGGRNGGFRELTLMAMEADASKETECRDGLPEEADTQENADSETWKVEPFAETVYVRVDGCKLKKGPGEKYETAGTLVLLEKLQATGKITDENGEEWYQISLPEPQKEDCQTGTDFYIKAEQVKQ